MTITKTQKRLLKKLFDIFDADVLTIYPYDIRGQGKSRVVLMPNEERARNKGLPGLHFYPMSGGKLLSLQISTIKPGVSADDGGDCIVPSMYIGDDFDIANVVMLVRLMTTTIIDNNNKHLNQNIN